jgi:hypothetical protein
VYVYRISVTDAVTQEDRTLYGHVSLVR